MNTFNGASTVSFKRQRSSVDQNEESINNYTTEEPRRKRVDMPPNHVLLYTIMNPRYPITTEVIHTISSPVGKVNRIVIFRKRAVQAMVEFENLENARKVKEALDGADIYSGCCTLKIEYAKPTKLNVFKNGADSWDYTAGKDPRPALLPEPSIANYQPQRPTVVTQSQQTQYGNNNNQTGGSSCYTPPVDQFDDFEKYDIYLPSAVHNNNERVDRNNQGILMKRSQTYNACDQRVMVLNHHTANPATAPSVNNNSPPSSVVGSSCVMMVYDLHPEKCNCDRLFNLFCLFGNVVKIKFLKSKEGCAMVQMGDVFSVERCITNMNQTPLMEGHQMSLDFSKQAFLSDTFRPFQLPDGTEGFKDFSSSKLNRFSTPAAASKNRVQPPSKILHFFNTPPNISVDELTREINNILDVFKVTSLKIFPNKGVAVRSSSGLVEFSSIAESVEALMRCNHLPIKADGAKFPFVMKLCFSSAKNVNYVPKSSDGL